MQRELLEAEHAGVQELGGQARVTQEVQRETAASALGDGCGILLTAAPQGAGPPCLGAAGLGQRGVTAEAVGEQAAGELLEDIASGACVDRWCAMYRSSAFL